MGNRYLSDEEYEALLARIPTRTTAELVLSLAHLAVLEGTRQVNIERTIRSTRALSEELNRRVPIPSEKP